MRSSFIVLSLFLLTITFSFTGCAKKVQMTDLTSEELKVEKKEQADKRAGIVDKTLPPVNDDSGEKILYGEIKGLNNVNKGALLDVLFDFDRYNLRGDSRAVLKENADLLRQFKGSRIILEGHCDERGTDDYNIALGERRAVSVKHFLKKLGLSTDQMVVISYGEEFPFCHESTQECWRQNRRVHFKVIK